MRKKTRSPMYAKPEKNKVMGMNNDLHDMDDTCDTDDIDDLDDICELEDEMDIHKHMGPMKDMKNYMCDKMPDCIMLAHSYVPWQTYEKAFTPSEALMKGTLFPELWGVYPIPK